MADGASRARNTMARLPTGDLIGRIHLPERCANLCFGGRHRNRLFMAASRSLHAFYVNLQGVGGWIVGCRLRADKYANFSGGWCGRTGLLPVSWTPRKGVS